MKKILELLDKSFSLLKHGKRVPILPEEWVAGGNGGVHDEEILDAELGAPPLPLLPALPPKFSSFQEGIVAPATSARRWFPKKITIQRRKSTSKLSDFCCLLNFPPSFIFLLPINRRLQEQNAKKRLSAPSANNMHVILQWPRIAGLNDWQALLRSWDVYPGSRILNFSPSRIPDLGSRNQKQQQKRGVKKKLVVLLVPFFVATNITKLKIILFWTGEEKNSGQFIKNYKTFYPKNCQ
jgi:hypothetical protein